MTRIVIAGLALVAWVGLLAVAVRWWPRWSKAGKRDWGDLTRTRVRPDLKRMALVIALVALPAAAAYMTWPYAACTGGGFDPGVKRHGRECVGVTDGRYRFSGEFADGEVGGETKSRFDTVEKLIMDQNSDVRSKYAGRYVKVAFLAPLTSPLSGPRVVHELEGAAAAQRWVNTPDRASPKIELLLAHTGRREEQWRPVVRQLTAMKDDRAPLVAVVGLGLSQDETRQAAEELARARIPMVADLVTATRLDPNQDIEGFHRVSYDNDEQLGALFNYLNRSGADLTRAVVVKSDDGRDSYSQTAANDIIGRLGSGQVPMEFGDPNGDPGTMGNQFRQISRSLGCRYQSHDAVIFYAGRALFLSNFIQRLDDEGCSAVVISASDAGVLRMERSADETAQQNWGVEAARQVLQKGKVKLLYTPLADPAVLQAKASGEYANLKDTFTRSGFQEADLQTGWAITAWDAMRVTAEWVWDAQSAVGNNAVPHADDVSRASTRKFTSSNDTYDGASGRIRFSAQGNRESDPPAVVRLTGDGSLACVTCDATGQVVWVGE